MAESVCDGFSEGVDVKRYCFKCGCNTTWRQAGYYDLAKCLSCGQVFEMVGE